MTYKETVAYLYDSSPCFQNVGQAAYKEGMNNTFLLDEHFGHPHQYYPTIHIAGTNGKGSCAHTLAAMLQASGKKVGLYTSPHLLDFRERIRVNGSPISEEAVISFVEKERSFFEPLHPSFFELTTAMAFKYFKDEKVDIAVIEVGLGGRLDCTNCIRPILSIITNISFDHMQFLGHSLEEIAGEKAGIIKKGVPIIIGETTKETKPVFIRKAEEVNAPIRFAEESQQVLGSEANYEDGSRTYQTLLMGKIHGQLGGLCQEKNANTILNAVIQLRKSEIEITDNDVRKGFENVCELTGLMGRWQKVRTSPAVVCDTGHNEGGFEYISLQLKAVKCKTLRIVFGMLSDKDIRAVLKIMPAEALYYFTKPSVKRAMNEKSLLEMAKSFGLDGQIFPTVEEAFDASIKDASPEDFIYVGGSSFVVADFLTIFDKP